MDNNNNILVSMFTVSKHIAVYNSNLEWLTIIMVNQECPHGLCVGDNGNIYIYIVCRDYSNCPSILYRVSAGGSGGSHTEVVLNITEDAESYGGIMSVAKQGPNLVLLFRKSFNVYQSLSSD